MSSIYTAFFVLLAVMLLVNAVLSVRLRSSLPLFYGAALLSFGLGQWFEAAGETAPWISSPAAIFAAIFIDRLLLLRKHASFLRPALYATAGAVLLTGILTWLSADAILLRLLYAASAGFIASLAAALYFTVRHGFRPALYSAIGLSLFLLGAAVYVIGRLGGLPDADWMRFALLSGFFAEFAFFLVSITSVASLAERNAPAPANLEHGKRYERRRLNKDRATELGRTITRFMEDERLYCDEDLSLDRLADLCGVSRHELSEYLNYHLGISFSRYINEFRVREVERLLRESPERSVLDAAFSAGFNSKSRFNSEFRRITGRNPRDFRRHIIQSK